MVVELAKHPWDEIIPEGRPSRVRASTGSALINTALRWRQTRKKRPMERGQTVGAGPLKRSHSAVVANHADRGRLGRRPGCANNYRVSDLQQLGEELEEEDAGVG